MDSTDRLRVHEAKKELFDLLGEEKLREALLVVLANKQARRLIALARLIFSAAGTWMLEKFPVCL